MKFPNLPFLVKNITPKQHQERIAELRRDFHRWPSRDTQTYEIDVQALEDAKTFLGLKLPVEIVFDSNYENLACLVVGSDKQVTYVPGRHTIVIRPCLPDDAASGTIFHELIHCAQAEANNCFGPQFMATINAFMRYTNLGDSPTYYGHPIELQAVGSEWMGEALKIAKPFGNFHLKPEATLPPIPTYSPFEYKLDAEFFQRAIRDIMGRPPYDPPSIFQQKTSSFEWLDNS